MSQAKFARGDTVRLTDDGYDFAAAGEELLICDVCVNAAGAYSYLCEGGTDIDQEWVREAHLEHLAPALAVHPPKFSSPEEADAWLEEQANPKHSWVVTVASADGAVSESFRVDIMANAPDPVATALAVAVREWPFMQPMPGNQPTSPAPF